MATSGVRPTFLVGGSPIQWEMTFVRRVTREGLIATIGFDVVLLAPHRGIHAPSGACGECRRATTELTRVALSLVPARDLGCIYQVFSPVCGPWAPPDEANGQHVRLVLRSLSREQRLNMPQVGCLRRIEESLRRLGATRRA